VRGLGRFLELRELSKQLEEEKKEREASAFAVRGVTPYGSADARAPTVPQPFTLATDRRATEAAAAAYAADAIADYDATAAAAAPPSGPPTRPPPAAPAAAASSRVPPQSRAASRPLPTGAARREMIAQLLDS